jgi:hypothetical protein
MKNKREYFEIEGKDFVESNFKTLKEAKQAAKIYKKQKYTEDKIKIYKIAETKKLVEKI